MTDQLATDPVWKKLRELEARINEIAQRSVEVNALEEFADDLGEQRAGMFIAGDGHPLDETLNGVAMMYPPKEIVLGGRTYLLSLLGCKDGVLQFGLSAEDGQAIFAGGDALIGVEGISINKMGYLIRHTASDGMTERTGSVGMWPTPGGTAPCYGIGFASPAGNELIINGTAETGDFSGWAPSQGAPYWTVVGEFSTGYKPHSGSYQFKCGATTTTPLLLTSADISVEENTGYRISHWSRFTSTLTANYYSFTLKWYDGANNLLRSDVIKKYASGYSEPYYEYIHDFTSPYNAEKLIIVIACVNTDNDANFLCCLDDISLKALAVNSTLYFDSSGALKLNGYDLIPDGGVFSPVTIVGYKGDGTRMSTPLTLNSANTKTGWQVQWGSGPAPTINSHYDAHVLLKAGIYTYRLYYGKATSFGKLDLYVDGVKQNATPVDLYASSASYDNEWAVTGVVVPYDGMHEIKLVAASKNASSSYYGANISFFAFEKTD